MAQIYGESAAFAALLQELFRIDSRMQPCDLEALDRGLSERRAELAQCQIRMPGEIVQEAAERLADLDRQLALLQQRHRKQSADADAHATAARHLAQARCERYGFILVRWYWRLRGNWADRHVQRRRTLLEREHAQAHLEVRQARERLLRMQADPGGEARRRLAREVGILEQLEAAARSPLAAAARSECDLLRELQQLPDDYVVLRGLKLESGPYVRIAGAPVPSEEVAQIVVGPTGVCVIAATAADVGGVEAQRAAHVAAHVARAGLLCRLLLESARLPSRVRMLVVHSGGAEPIAADAPVSVLGLGQLAAHVCEAEPALGPAAVRGAADFLARFQIRRQPLAGELGSSVVRFSHAGARRCGRAAMPSV
jgi:hypothetical protein